MTSKGELVLHIGYPKTATTTLQIGLFSRCPDLNYLGKFLPSHRFADDALHDLMWTAQMGNFSAWREMKQVHGAALMQAVQREPDKVSVLSSENFLHSWSQSPDVVAKRLHEVAPEARILITVREQVAFLRSWYRWHGGYGQYLFLNKYIDEACEFPLSADEWLHYQFAAPDRNVIGILEYDAIIDAFEDLFGADRVHVLCYETLVKNPMDYFGAIAEVFALPLAQVVEALENVHENSEKNPYSERESGEPLTGNFSPNGIARIRAKFAASNSKLEAKRNLGLAEAGYAMDATMT